MYCHWHYFVDRNRPRGRRHPLAGREPHDRAVRPTNRILRPVVPSNKGQAVGYHLSREKQILAVKLLAEGNTIRGTERVVGIHRDSVMRLLLRVGEHCSDVLDKTIRDIKTESVQIDELWGFVGKKQRRVGPGDPAWMGDQYIYVALDARTKLVLCHGVGKRTGETTDRFIEDLAGRIVGPVQLSTDGFEAYRPAIRRHFNGRAAYCQVVKNYEGPHPEDQRRYGPPRIASTTINWVQGFPRRENTSTSFVERSNWTWRLYARRLTRLSNGFSRKLKNLEAQMALTFAAYNFCKKNRTVGMPPALAARVADHWWDYAELVPEWGN